MSRKRAAIVLGGSGSVGTALLRELFHDDGFDTVISSVDAWSLPAEVEAGILAAGAGNARLDGNPPDVRGY